MSTAITTVHGGICAPQGYRASAVHAGFYPPPRLDQALITSNPPATAAGMFTTSQFPAAGVTLCKKRINNPIAGIIVNSGNANAWTTRDGLQCAEDICAAIATLLNAPAENFLHLSTGVIGKDMPPVESLHEAFNTLVHGLGNSPEHAARAAHAIMTTDTIHKETARQIITSTGTITIGGMTKGSGMISPNLATLLTFITTDAALTKTDLQECLCNAVDVSLNCLTIDGDMSTNDSVILLANGAAGQPPLNENDKALFCEALKDILTELTILMAHDAEGATKCIMIDIINADSNDAARTVGLAVANSLLVKTAVHGNDANWGRILARLGKTSVHINPYSVRILFADTIVFEKGHAVPFDEKKMKNSLADTDEIAITIDLNNGTFRQRIFTCDLSAEYVKINASYRS